MKSSVRIGDKIKLNYDVKAFNITDYIDGLSLHCFNHIQLYISESNNNPDIQNKEFLFFKSPIILFDYEEELLEIIHENSRRIGYTKSFKIDLLKAIEENEIIINSTSNSGSPAYQFHQYFIHEILEINQNYSWALITEAERKSRIMDSFVTFYNSINKKETEQFRHKEKLRRSNLTDEAFFSESWNRYSQEDLTKGITSQKNNITLIWSSSAQKLGWINQFAQEGIEKGIDQKTKLEVFFDGQLRISRIRHDWNNCLSYYTVTITRQNLKDQLRYIVDFWDSQVGSKRIEVENLWQDLEFQNMLGRIIAGPIC